MRKILALGLVAMLALSFGCKKKEGPAGPDGPEGPQGPQGPAGPLNVPPKIFSLSPDSGSYRNIVTITGENFSDVAADNEVWFDGNLATVLTAATDTLTVQPMGVDVQTAQTMDVTVITGNQASNAHAFDALPRGTASFLPVVMLRDVAGIDTNAAGDTMFVADRLGGVLQVDVATGLATEIAPLSEQLLRPAAIARHPVSGDLWVADDRSALADGSSMRVVSVNPATGEITPRLVTGLVNFIVDISIDPATGFVHTVTDDPPGGTNNAVNRFDAAGAFIGQIAAVTADTDAFSSTILGDQLFISGDGATPGIYQIDLAAPANTAAPIVLDTALASFRGISVDAGNALLMITSSVGVSTVDPAMNPAPVVQYSNFGMPAFLLTGDSHFVGADLFISSISFSGAQQTSIWTSPDGTAVDVVAMGVGSVFVGSILFAPNGVGYIPSGDCNSTGHPASPIIQLNTDGSTQVFSSVGGCSSGIGITSDNRIIAPDLLTSQVFSIDIGTGVPTVILDFANDGVVPLSATVNGNFIYMDDLAGGNIIRSDTNGGNLNAAFSAVGGAIAFGLAVADGTLFFADANNVFMIDAAAGGAPSISATTVSAVGLPVGASATLDGTALLGPAVTLGGLNGTIFEINNADVVMPVLDVPNPLFSDAGFTGVAPNGDFVILSLIDAQLIRVTP